MFLFLFKVEIHIRCTLWYLCQLTFAIYISYLFVILGARLTNNVKIINNKMSGLKILAIVTRQRCWAAWHVCPSKGPWCSCGGGVGRIALPRRFQVVSSVGSRVPGPGNLLHQCPVTCQARPSCGHCSGHWLEPAAGRVSPAAGDKIMWHPSPLLVSADIILISHHHVPAKSLLLQVKHDMSPQINQKCCRYLLQTAMFT